MVQPAAAELSDEMAHLLRVLGHPVRLQIVRLTSLGERGVSDVADAIGLSQPLTSQHLKVLRDNAIVEVRRDGNRRLYRTNTQRTTEIRAFLDELWPATLQSLKAAAERRHRERGTDD